MPVTGHGRHAAGRPPNLALPLVSLVFLLALAAGGWILFAQPSGGQTIELAGDSAVLPSRAPEAPAPPPSHPAQVKHKPVPAAPSAPAPVADDPGLLPALGLPQLLPKTAAELERLTGPVTKLNWPAMARCESHGNPRAVNSRGGYYGLYQFSKTSWRSVGGTGLPHQASPEEQTLRAQMLYMRVNGRWQGQWPHCGRHLFTR